MEPSSSLFVAGLILYYFGLWRLLGRRDPGRRRVRLRVERRQA